MIEATDAELFFGCDCEEDESEAWRTIYYDDLDDAVEAVRASDVLGIACSLSQSWSEYDLDGAPLGERRWAVELRTEMVLPDAATGCISLVL
jgi:hypothetical protein